jgi:hypothetical protein
MWSDVMVQRSMCHVDVLLTEAIAHAREPAGAAGHPCACASPTVRTQPTPTPAATSVPFPSPLTGLLGPAPKSCPAGCSPSSERLLNLHTDRRNEGVAWTPKCAATDEPLTVLDLAWPEGLQEGYSQPVALLLEEDREQEDILNRAGYRYFVDVESLRSYVEKEILALAEVIPVSPGYS